MKSGLLAFLSGLARAMGENNQAKAKAQQEMQNRVIQMQMDRIMKRSEPEYQNQMALQNLALAKARLSPLEIGAQNLVIKKAENPNWQQAEDAESQRLIDEAARRKQLLGREKAPPKIPTDYNPYVDNFIRQWQDARKSGDPNIPGKARDALDLPKVMENLYIYTTTLSLPSQDRLKISNQVESIIRDILGKEKMRQIIYLNTTGNSSEAPAADEYMENTP